LSRGLAIRQAAYLMERADAEAVSRFSANHGGITIHQRGTHKGAETLRWRVWSMDRDTT
jgi:hypothetical protein